MATIEKHKPSQAASRNFLPKFSPAAASPFVGDTLMSARLDALGMRVGFGLAEPRALRRFFLSLGVSAPLAGKACERIVAIEQCGLIDRKGMCLRYEN